jgi:hypothetical protein
MSEWLKEHAWKLIPLARADTHQIPPRHFRFNNFRNIDARQRVPVSDGVAPGFRGVCDTVLTQNPNTLRMMRISVRRYALPVPRFSSRGVDGVEAVFRTQPDR